MIDTTVSHYHILERLGEGGMGVVYKARDLNLDRFVALKFLSSHLSGKEQEKARFVQEAKAASALDHPNICTIHEIDQSEDEHLFISMAYYEGETLRERIKWGAIDLQQAVRLVVQIASGLARAHESEIIHRDIKPANIIITRQDEAKIVDFGLAKLAGSAGLTRSGETLGTAAYMSPEQIHGQEVDHRSDLFSLGIVFYEMVTGIHPFLGDYEPALMYGILYDDPKPLTGTNGNVPAELEHILNRMLAKKPEERYQQTEELIEDLQALRAQLQSGTAAAAVVQARPAAKKPEAKPAASRLTRFFPAQKQKAAGAFISVALLALVLVLGLPSSRQTVKRWLGVQTVPETRHIAVLAFTNVGGDPANQALCDGLVETLTSKLSQLEQFQGQLWVVPATEIRKSKITTAGEARQLYGASLVIAGSVQRFDSLLRLTINLIDANTLRQLESKMIDDPMTNVSILQDEAVVVLAEMLNVQMTPQTRRVLHAGATTVPGAYEFYLRGRGTLQRYDRVENIDAAIELFERALRADSSYALAYAGLGEAYLRKFQATKEVSLVDLAVQDCERALQIDRLLPAAHVTLGLLHAETGQYQQALEAFQQALELDSHNVDAHRGRARAFMAQGQLDEAEAIYKKAISLKPDYWGGYNDLGVFYFRHGRYEEAIPQFQHVVELTPRNAKGYRNLGSMYFTLNRHEEAIANYNKALEIQPGYSISSNLATLYFQQGDYAKAARMYEKALEMRDTDYRVWGYLASAYRQSPGEAHKAQEATKRAVERADAQWQVNPHDPNVLLSLAGYYSDLGQQDKSLSLLRQAAAVQSKDVAVMYAIGYVYEQLNQRDEALKWIGRALANGHDPAQIEKNPRLRDLRADARFQKLINK
ncbi:MAG: tetratricopeptide repeat protein [bacterium]